jgi:hypothetical protein
VNLTRNLRDILTEDKELLERLAKWLTLTKSKKYTTFL